MKDEKVNIDKNLRKKFEDFSVQPPPHIWDNLQGQIIAQKKQRRIAYIAWISAAAVIVLAFIAGWHFNINTQIESPFSVEEQKIQSEIESSQNSINTESNRKIENNLKEKSLIVDTNLKKENEIIDVVKTAANSTIQNEQTTFNTAINLSEKENIGSNYSSNSKNRLMNRIESKNVFFSKKYAETNVLEENEKSDRSGISNFDELIMANNVSVVQQIDKNETGWKMGMYISPSYSSNVSSHSLSYAQNMNNKSKNGNGNVGGGVSVQYKTSKKLRIESGVYFAQSGEKSSSSINLFSRKNDVNDAVYVSSDNELSNVPAAGFSNVVNLSNGNMLMNSTAGVIEMNGAPKGTQINTTPEMFDARFSNTLVTDGEFSQVFDFIEIPLYLRYNLVDSKFGIELMGGINAGLVIGNNAYIDNSSGVQKIGKTQDISTMNFSGTVGFAANYDLGKHISLALEPRLNYYFKSISNNPSVNFRPYRIGFYTGLYYEF